MIVFEMIQEVQKELRMPQSSSLTDAHAKLILAYLNKVQRNFMLEAVVWDELKTYGNFDTRASVSTYAISVVSDGEVDIIRNLQIGTNSPLIKKSDEEFRELKRTLTTNGQPLYYRHFSRQAGNVVIELLPVPDAEYQIDAEVLIKPPKLINDADVPLLDPDTIILGAIVLAKREQGEDFQPELAAFQVKLGLQSDTQGESNWQDVEAV